MTSWLTIPEPGSACAIVAEVGLGHDGSLGLAHAFVDAVAAVGADAVKFQTHLAEAESTTREAWRVPFSRQDPSRFDYWRRTAFDEAGWRGLKAHAQERSIAFMSSPFSLEAAQLLERVGVSAWKIASGEITNTPLLEFLSTRGRPVLLSTGLSGFAEIDAAVMRLQGGGASLAVMQCTSLYPTPPEAVGLNLLAEFAQRYGTAVGLSDHSGTIYAGLAAATQGALVVEVHVTLDRQMFGPDVVASLTMAELATLVKGIRFVEAMNANPLAKDEPMMAVRPLRRLFMKSVVAALDLCPGTIIERRHLALKKPADGLPPSALDRLLERRLKVPLACDQAISEDDLEPLKG